MSHKRAKRTSAARTKVGGDFLSPEQCRKFNVLTRGVEESIKQLDKKIAVVHDEIAAVSARLANERRTRAKEREAKVRRANEATAVQVVGSRHFASAKDLANFLEASGKLGLKTRALESLIAASPTLLARIKTKKLR